MRRKPATSFSVTLVPHVRIRVGKNVTASAIWQQNGNSIGHVGPMRLQSQQVQVKS